MKKSYDSKFKSRVALEALQGNHSIAEIASEFNIHPNLVSQWKKKLLQESADIFATKKLPLRHHASCLTMAGS